MEVNPANAITKNHVHMYPVVSIVGRPNVGKSTIFNRLLGERQAIVDDTSGVTRDRHYGESFWKDRDFTVIDTGGYLPGEKEVIAKGTSEQVEIAIEESDVILFVVDVTRSITDLDEKIADMLLKQDKPVIVAANKADNEERKWNAAEFYRLGLDRIFPLSGINGTGSGELLDELVTLLPDSSIMEQDSRDIPRLALIGRPNVGKSSLLNSLLEDERSIVTDVPGTTRDSINSLLEYQDKSYMLMDTAGLRRKTRIKHNVEFYSTVRTERSIRNCDVAVLLIDAVEGFEAQDARILREAERFNKGLVIALNKWDLADTGNFTFDDYVKAIRARIPNMRYIPIISISATGKKRIFKVIEQAEQVLQKRKLRITTGELNRFVERVVKERPLPFARGHPLRINYATQLKSNPPVFGFFMNNPKDLPANYRKFLENKFREEYDFTGVPVTMTFRQK